MLPTYVLHSRHMSGTSSNVSRAAMDEYYDYSAPGLPLCSLYPDVPIVGLESLSDADLESLLQETQPAFSFSPEFSTHIAPEMRNDNDMSSCSSDILLAPGSTYGTAGSSHPTGMASERYSDGLEYPGLPSCSPYPPAKSANLPTTSSSTAKQHPMFTIDTAVGADIVSSEAPATRRLSASISSKSSPEAAATPNSEATEEWKPDDLFDIGYVDCYGDWRCRFEGCKSTKTYERACDLRKHYKGHVRRYFCEEDGCKWATIGFSSKKDMDRHSNTHSPKFRCPALECDRTFSRAGMYLLASTVIWIASRT